MTDDFLVHEPESIDSEPHDIEDHIEVLKAFEWRIEVQDILSSGNKVATREVIYGTQIDEFEGLPPSGKELSASSILIWEVEDGKVAEVWSSPDSHTFLEGLGLTFPRILITLPKVLSPKGARQKATAVKQFRPCTTYAFHLDCRMERHARDGRASGRTR